MAPGCAGREFWFCACVRAGTERNAAPRKAPPISIHFGDLIFVLLIIRCSSEHPRILRVTYTFLPIVGPDAIETIMFAGELPGSGCKVSPRSFRWRIPS